MCSFRDQWQQVGMPLLSRQVELPRTSPNAPKHFIRSTRIHHLSFVLLKRYQNL
ncbi:hypothetical protein CRYUN_Cryun22dG0091500 [Craigia yunnanensis]